MKHTFAKKALLLGAATIFLNTVPVHAMSDMGVPATTPSAIKAQVAQKARQFGKWAQDQAGRLSLERRLNSAMKFLDKQFKNVMKCLRGEGCTRGQIVAITATLATIMAIVTVLGGRAYMKKYEASKFKFLHIPGDIRGAGQAVSEGAGQAVSEKATGFAKGVKARARGLSEGVTGTAKHWFPTSKKRKQK